MSNEWRNDARKIPDDTMSYIRKIAVRAVVESGFRPAVVAAVLKISPGAVYQWVKWYEDGGYAALETCTAPGAKPLITTDMEAVPKGIILDENPTAYGYDTPLWTCPIVAEVILKLFGVNVLPSTVDIHSRKMGLSPQKPRYIARERDPVEVAYFLDEKFPRIQRLAKRLNADIGFEDEAGIALNEHAGRTWGLVGRTPAWSPSGSVDGSTFFRSPRKTGSWTTR